MNINRLYQDTIDKKFTDVEIILWDGHNELILHSHKTKLIENSEYFYRLFSFNNTKTYKMEVLNVFVMRNIIMKFYDITLDTSYLPKWEYILTKINILNYLCLPIDISKLYNITVPHESFEFLLQTISLFNTSCDLELIKTIKKNLPSNFDISILNHWIPNLVTEINKSKIIISGNSIGVIKIHDFITSSTIREINTKDVIHSMIVSNNYEIIFTGSNSKIDVWNLNTGEQIDQFLINSPLDPINALSISTDNKYIAYGTDNGLIGFIDIKTKLDTHIHKDDKFFIGEICFLDNKLVTLSEISYGKESYIKFWSINDRQLLHQNQIKSVPSLINRVNVSHDCLNILYIDGSRIKVLDTNFVEKTIFTTSKLDGAIFNHDKTLIFGYDEYGIRSYDIITGNKIKYYPYDIDTSCLIHISFCGRYLFFVGRNQNPSKIYTLDTEYNKIIDTIDSENILWYIMPLF